MSIKSISADEYALVKQVLAEYSLAEGKVYKSIDALTEDGLYPDSIGEIYSSIEEYYVIDDEDNFDEEKVDHDITMLRQMEFDISITRDDSA